MTIEARHLHSWIGTEVLDGSGEKLGKLDEIYFRGSEPLAVSIRSGLGGRKHHAAALAGATVSRDSLHLDVAPEQIIAIEAGGIGAEQLAKLAKQDDRLDGVEPGDLEGWNARVARLKAQAEAQAVADKLEEEAQRRAKEEDAATSRARVAEGEVEQARRARREAEVRAQQARRDADKPG